MVREVVADMDGQVFWYSDLLQRVLAKYPKEGARVRRGMYVACHGLLHRKVIIKVPGGFIRAEAASPPKDVNEPRT